MYLACRIRRSLLWLLAFTFPPAFAATASNTPVRPYKVEYRAELLPDKGIAAVAITVEQIRGRLSVAEFPMPRTRYSRVTGDGNVRIDGDLVRWELPKEGGTLRFDYKIDHRRANGSFDVRITPDWALFRLDDVFPSARTVARRGAVARAHLELAVPNGWDVETPYGPYEGRPLAFENAA